MYTPRARGWTVGLYLTREALCTEVYPRARGWTGPCLDLPWHRSREKPPTRVDGPSNQDPLRVWMDRLSQVSRLFRE